MTTPTASTPTPAPRRDELFSPTMQRLAAASGLIAALLILVSAFVFGGDSPDWGDPAADYGAYYADDGDKLQAGALLLALASIEILWFAGFLRGELGRLEMASRGFARVAPAVLAGLALVAAGLTLVSVVDAGLSELAGDTSPEILKALTNSLGGMFMLVPVGGIVAMTGTALVILATRALPVWIAWVGLVASLGWFAVLFFILAPSSDSPLGIGFFVGFLGFVIWLIGLSVTFLRRVGRVEASTAL